MGWTPSWSSTVTLFLQRRQRKGLQLSSTHHANFRCLTRILHSFKDNKCKAPRTARVSEARHKHCKRDKARVECRHALVWLCSCVVVWPCGVIVSSAVDCLPHTTGHAVGVADLAHLQEQAQWLQRRLGSHSLSPCRASHQQRAFAPPQQPDLPPPSKACLSSSLDWFGASSESL